MLMLCSNLKLAAASKLVTILCISKESMNVGEQRSLVPAPLYLCCAVSAVLPLIRHKQVSQK